MADGVRDIGDVGISVKGLKLLAGSSERIPQARERRRRNEFGIGAVCHRRGYLCDIRQPFEPVNHVLRCPWGYFGSELRDPIGKCWYFSPTDLIAPIGHGCTS